MRAYNWTLTHRKRDVVFHVGGQYLDFTVSFSAMLQYESVIVFLRERSHIVKKHTHFMQCYNFFSNYILHAGVGGSVIFV